MLLLPRTFPLLPSEKEESEIGEFFMGKTPEKNGIKKRPNRNQV